MISKIDKNADRKKRHERVRVKISGTPECPRLCVYRSLNNVYAQLIDDVAGNTLVTASTLDKALKGTLDEMTKTEQAKAVGALIAKKALEKGIETVVFDRAGYLYIGRVAALADGAREGGLKF